MRLSFGQALQAQEKLEEAEAVARECVAMRALIEGTTDAGPAQR